MKMLCLNEGTLYARPCKVYTKYSIMQPYFQMVQTNPMLFVTSRGGRNLVPRASPLPFPWSAKGRGKRRGEALGTRLRWPIEEFWKSDIPWMVTPRKWCWRVSVRFPFARKGNEIAWENHRFLCTVTRDILNWTCFIMETLVLRPSKFRKKNNTQGDDKNCKAMLSNNIKQDHFEILAS